jgi:hypothetical protein
VRRTARKTENESYQVPTDRTHKSGEQDLLVNHLEVYETGANGLSDCSAEDESRDELPKCSPHDGRNGEKTRVETTVAIDFPMKIAN